MSIKDLKKPSLWSTGISGYVLLIGALVVNMIIQGGGFFTVSSLSSLLSSNLALVIAALAQMVVMASGGIDISLGNIMALVNGVAIVLSNAYGLPVAASWGIALLAGTGIGLANGLIISLLRIPPLLVTFAMSTFVKGISLVVLPKPGGSIPPEIYKAYGGEFLGVPTAAWLIILAAVVLMLFSKFRISKHLLAVGTNERNAYISGIHVDRVKVYAYTMGGLIAAFAGLCLTALTASGDVRVGEAFALQSIAAVIIGGTLGSGKWGSHVLGAICGALFLAIVNNIVFFVFNMIAMSNPDMMVSTFYQQLLSNFIIIFGLASAVLTNKKNYKRIGSRKRKESAKS